MLSTAPLSHSPCHGSDPTKKYRSTYPTEIKSSLMMMLMMIEMTMVMILMIMVMMIADMMVIMMSLIMIIGSVRTYLRDWSKPL